MGTNKIKNDKYYTPKELAGYCVSKTNELIGLENITEYLEPSAGAGVYLPFFDKPYLAFDIEPENENITKQDFLTLDLSYKKGRCIITNPPFGYTNQLSVKFFKKAITLGDYVSFILPISQLNNNSYFYEFDMIHSENLKPQMYSGNRKVHCCLNIFKRNESGLLNKKDKTDFCKMEDVVLKGVSNTLTSKSRNDKIPEKYDFSICSFGSVGKICERENQYSQQTYFTINPKFRDEVYELVKNTDFIKLYGMEGMLRLKHWQIYKFLRENIKGIK